MALANYQFTFGSFMFGANTPYQVTELDGIEGLPSLRVQDDSRGYNDGAFSGRDFYDGRTLTFTIQTFATAGGATAHANFSALQAALQPQQSGTQILQFLLSSAETEKQLSARVRTRKTVVDPEYTFGFIRSQVTFYCPEPRYFDNVLQTAILAPPATINGRTYDRVYSMTFGSGSTSTAIISNAGWIYATPTITVNGPFTSVTVGAQEQQASITVNATLSSSDALVFDLAQRLVTLNGSSARNLVAAGSKWFNAPPGNSTYYMTAANSTAGTTAGTVTWRNAYI